MNNETDALIVVDFQNDFAHPEGSLYVTDAEQCVQVINQWLELFRQMKAKSYLTRDWHPEKHISFKTWPVHCVQNTWGARFYEGILYEFATLIVNKGEDIDQEQYSGFPALKQVLPETVENLIVCGLATDYCVKATVLDAVKAGYNVRVISDGIQGVNINPLDGANAILEMEKAGAEII